MSRYSRDVSKSEQKTGTPLDTRIYRGIVIRVGRTHTGSVAFWSMFAVRLPVAVQSRCLPRYFFTHARLSLPLERVLFHALRAEDREVERNRVAG